MSRQHRVRFLIASLYSRCKGVPPGHLGHYNVVPPGHLGHFDFLAYFGRGGTGYEKFAFAKIYLTKSINTLKMSR